MFSLASALPSAQSSKWGLTDSIFPPTFSRTGPWGHVCRASTWHPSSAAALTCLLHLPLTPSLWVCWLEWRDPKQLHRLIPVARMLRLGVHSPNKQTWTHTLVILQPEHLDALRAWTAFLLCFLCTHTTRGRFVITFQSLHNYTFP